MKVRFTTSISYAFGPSYAPGDVGIIDDDEAARLLKAGYCEVVEETTRRETATGRRGRRKATNHE